MSNDLKTLAGHSAQYFGDTRDHWWHDDFIAMVARRWGVDRAERVLDVGCGVGHWGRLLSRVLPVSATIVGIDREAMWIEKATEKAATAGTQGRFDYRVASAESLPLDDATFDLVTCQTVLMHAPDPEAVLREMVRVTRPGGLILAAEPTNVAGVLLSSIALDDSPDEVASLLHFQLVCERGKRLLREGNNLIGESLLRLFTEAGIEHVEIRQNDRVWPLVPPYESPFERAQVEEGVDAVARRVWVWDEPTTRRYFLAGGGTACDFAVRWAAAMAQNERWVEAVRQKRYSVAGGGLSYLICGRRPAQQDGG
jgi:SAM-dependent methyltransferase